MKKAPKLPFDEKYPSGPIPAPDPMPDDDEVYRFADSLDFRRRLNDPDFPEKGTGMHVPLWVTPKLAQELLGQHSKTGFVIPHQNDDL